MKTAVALIFAFSTLGALGNISAEDGQADRLQQDAPAKRISSINWNTQTGKLEWVVQSGVEHDGHFMPTSQEEHYEISPEQASMAFQGQQRGFTTQEAEWLANVLHILTVYCAESTVWWEQGKGVPLDNHGKPLHPDQQPSNPLAPQPDNQDTGPHKVLYQPGRRVPGAVRLVVRQMVH
ncbi:MAG TPA: hypothetical protein VKV17_06900 [Bryobacteraceae bacterium]|nr:hypothetical protein [Bryobacteraceae bacterium]